MSSYEYKVVDLTVEVSHNSQTTLAVEAEAVINRHAKEGWRLHTYRVTSFGRVPGVLGIKFENVCHLVFERATEEQVKTRSEASKPLEVTPVESEESEREREDLERRRAQNKAKVEEGLRKWLDGKGWSN